MSKRNPILKQLPDGQSNYLAIEVFDNRDNKKKHILVDKIVSAESLSDAINNKVSKGGDVILGDLTIRDGIIIIERSGLGLLMKGAANEQAPLQIFNNPDAAVNQRFTKVGVRDQLLYSVESDSGTELATGNNVKLITVDTNKNASIPNGGLTTNGKIVNKVNNYNSTSNIGSNVYNALVNTNSVASTLTIQSDDIEAGREWFIKDETGNAAANNITIATQGAETIDGAATYVINSNYGKVCLFSDGTNLFVKHE